MLEFLVGSIKSSSFLRKRLKREGFSISLMMRNEVELRVSDNDESFLSHPSPTRYSNGRVA